MDLKYHIVTLGCQMNRSDCERVQTVVEELGYQCTDQEEDASLLGILACSVRQKSIDKIYSKIRKWNSWKNKKNLLTFVSGCVLPADRKKFLKLFDMIFSVTEIFSLPEMIRSYGIVTPVVYGDPISRPAALNGHERFKIEPAPATLSKPLISKPDERIRAFWSLKPAYASSYEAYIPIQNGCDKFCTFCAVPYTRGREISRSSGEILSELKQLVNNGYKSITLLGQNVNSYGLDKHGNEITFAGLLREIGEFGRQSGKMFWVYYTSPHPRDMHTEVLKVMAEYRCIARQVHLPLQSGDDHILARMNRKHTLAEYMNVTDRIRYYLPDATIFTDVIVGFSGETKEQFENTRLAMQRIGFNMAYIAAYSPRPGAVSDSWDDDVPMTEKKNRLRILTEELMVHALKYNEKLLGKELSVLVTGPDRKPGFLSGITEGRIVVRFYSENPALVGNFVRLKITDVTSLSIEGELINEEKGVFVRK